MGKRASLNPYGGPTPTIDKLIGDAYPHVVAVAAHLDDVRYIVFNMEAIVLLAEKIKNGDWGSGGGGNPGPIPEGPVSYNDLDEELSSKIDLIALIDPLSGLPDGVWATLQKLAQENVAIDGKYKAAIDVITNTLNDQGRTLAVINGSGEGSFALAFTRLNASIAGQAARIDTVLSRTGAVESSVQEVRQTTATQATALTQLQTKQGENFAAVQTLQQTQLGQASSLSTLQAKQGEQTTSIQTLQEVDAIFGGQYVVKLDVNGVVAGFGITNKPGTIGTEMKFRADRIAFVNPSGVGDYPFQVVDGVTYIKRAVIQQATIGFRELETGGSYTHLSKTALVEANPVPRADQPNFYLAGPYFKNDIPGLWIVSLARFNANLRHATDPEWSLYIRILKWKNDFATDSDPDFARWKAGTLPLQSDLSHPKFDVLISTFSQSAGSKDATMSVACDAYIGNGHFLWDMYFARNTVNSPRLGNYNYSVSNYYK